MVGFGTSIVKAQREAWRGAYLDYETLKGIVNEINATLKETKSVGFADARRNLDEILLLQEGTSVSKRVEGLKQAFFGKLKSEIEKTSLFILQQQGDIADSVGALRFHSAVFEQKTALLRQQSGVGDGDLDTNNIRDQYSILGVELLHLLKFVCINSIGVQKILKKYNKCFERFDEPHNYKFSGDHLQQLAYSPSIRAIESSLQSALVECFSALPDAESLELATLERLQISRFQCVMSCNDALRRNAEVLQAPFLEFLSHKAMIVTGANLGGMGGRGKKALKWLIELQPDGLLTMSQVQLEQLWKRWSGGPTASKAIEEERPKKGHLRTPSLLTLGDETLGELVKEDELHWGGVDSTSMKLNLLSIFLYTVNYYIVAPTANHYAIRLGTDGAFGSTLIGASSFAAIFAAFFYSYWYTRSSFKSLLLFSTLCPVFGNFFYALAISYTSMPMAIFGRVLCGFGSAEVANRQLISACVNFEGMVKASALFVAAGAVGMSVGPLLAGFMDLVLDKGTDFHIHGPFLPADGLIFNHTTSPGYLMAFLWLLEFIFLLFFFAEPTRINGAGDNGSNSSSSKSSLDDSSRSGSGDEESPLLVIAEGYGSVPIEQAEITVPVQKEESHASLWDEVVFTVTLIIQNPGLPLTVVIFGYIEMVCEVLISSCSMVVRRYFGWKGSVAGFLIASLGALVLPAHFVVEKASHHYSERKILSVSGPLDAHCLLYASSLALITCPIPSLSEIARLLDICHTWHPQLVWPLL